MYVNEKWYKLIVKEETFDANDLVKGLDVSILQDHLLSQVLEIHDPRSIHASTLSEESAG